MRRRALEALADRIEATLAGRGLSLRVTGGRVAPRWIRFRATLDASPPPAAVARWADELARALQAERCRLSRRAGELIIEIPHPDPRPVRLLPLQRRLARRGEIPPGAAVLGLADDGAPLLARLPSPRVGRLLVAGAPGAGQRALLRTIVLSLALSHRPRELGFLLLETDGALSSLAGLPHLFRPPLREPRRIRRTLEALARRIDARGRRPRVVVAIDDLADLLLASRRPTHRALTRLARYGPTAGLHLLACTRHPRELDDLADHFPTRLVGRVTSPQEARAATGYAGTGAEQLRGPGAFIAVTGGQVTRFCAADVSPRELARVVDRMGRVPPPPPTRAPTERRQLPPVRRPARPAATATELLLLDPSLARLFSFPLIRFPEEAPACTTR